MITEKDLIEDIEGFPIEVVEKMLERQEEATGTKNIQEFQEQKDTGFPWGNTEEDSDFWYEVIVRRNFDLFFNHYPIPYPKKMYVSNTGDLTDKKMWHETEVLLKIEDKFLAVDKDSSVDATSLLVNRWNYAIDKWRYNQMKEPKKEVLHNALNASDFVLVRDKKENVWMLEIFSHMNYENAPYPFICFRDNYTFCIPFKGNEHLLNTNKNEM